MVWPTDQLLTKYCTSCTEALWAMMTQTFDFLTLKKYCQLHLMLSNFVDMFWGPPPYRANIWMDRTPSRHVCVPRDACHLTKQRLNWNPWAAPTVAAELAQWPYISYLKFWGGVEGMRGEERRREGDRMKGEGWEWEKREGDGRKGFIL